MAGIRGKIINPPTIKTEIIEALKAEIVIHTTGMYYQSSSTSSFLSTDNAWFLPLDLSNINNIFTYPDPILYGQSIFRNRQTEQKIPLFFNGNKSEDDKLQTTTYTISTVSGCGGDDDDCIINYTYENEFGETISGSINPSGSKSITFCSSTIPVTNVVSSCRSGCATSFVIGRKCNVLDPSITENNQILYIDNGKKYQLLSSRNESKNYGWQPISNEELFPYVERSDFDSFDFPQVTIRGTRKIPTSIEDTLCGPITYTGYTYDRMNYNWFFGNNAGITFNPIQTGLIPTPLSGAMVSQEGVASISNREGQLLFYTNGETVYTSGHTVMSNGTGLESSGTSTQSSIIIPKPDSNKYYIFTTDFNGNPNGFEYSIVNMDLKGGLGEIETKNIKLINSPLSEKVTACSHSNEDDYWVITHTSGDTSFYSYKISSAGLSGPVITSIGSTYNTARGYMKTSPDCTKLISLLYDEDIIDIFDFEASAGTLSNFMTITGKTFDVGPYGLEFSSDSSKFYVSEGASEKIYQFDLSYTTSTDILDNIIEVAEVEGGSLGALQMAPDERIYVADKSTYLSCLSGFTLVGENCVSTTTATTVTAETITAAGTSIAYSAYGARFCIPGTYTTCGSGATASNFFNTGNSDPFWGTLAGVDGRLNEVGVWVNEPPVIEDEWIGFSTCISAATDGQYLVALAGDNGIRFSLDGTQLVENPWDTTITAVENFRLWWVWPLDLTAGEHVINLEGIDDASVASFGCEIIGPFSSGTFTTNTDFHIFTGATGKDSYTANTIFKSSDEIGNTFDTQANTCPTGYTYDVCSDSCIKVESPATISEKPYLHVIHRPNGLGVQCNFQENGFNLSSSTVTGTSSTWGLPNVITDKAISCDRYVYITSINRVGFGFDFLVNNVNNVVFPKKLSYYGEIYKYDQTTSEFSTSALQTFNISYDSLSANTGNTLTIASGNIGEGEFLIKPYWDYNVNTLIAKQQKTRKSSVNTYKRGDLYGLYVPETDWYFINIFEASQPLFNSSSVPPAKTINSLVVASTVTQAGVKKYNIQGLSDPIVSYNGAILAKNMEYSAVTAPISATTGTTAFIPYIELSFDPLDGQILTYAYVKNGNTNDLLADLYIVSGITSGETGTQLETDRVFYNTTEGKYEFYLISVSSSNVILSVNGSMLAINIEYFQSFSNSRRIILEEPLNNGDIIEAFYVPTNAINGGIDTNTPQISWSIDTAPLTTSGKFTVQVTTVDDINYENVVYSEVVDYVIGQKSYNKLITLTNAKAGDKFIYRVMNEKFYTPIIGETIYSVSYSFTNKIEVLNNSGENY